MHKYLILLILCFPGLLAAQTGDTLRTVLISGGLLDGDTLDIYFHIPSSYSPSSPSKMVMGLHGLGNPETSTQIREYLSPFGDSINAIVICPDPYLGEEDKNRIIINLAIDSARSWYNVDTSQLYISGYSAGSDAAAHYALEDPEYPMKGFVWHSPGFFATPDMANESAFPPICLCSGDIDFVSLLQANTLNSTFSSASFPYLYNVLPGVAHTMEYPALTDELLECYDFFLSSATGLNKEVHSNAHFSVFPNPVSNTLHVQIHSSLTSPGSFTLINSNGKTMQSYTLLPAQMAYELELADLPNGIYLLHSHELGTRRIVVQK